MRLIFIRNSDNSNIMNINNYLFKLLKILAFIYLFYFKEKIKKKNVQNIYHKNNNQQILFNKYNDFNLYNQTHIILNITFINYSVSYKYNITKIEYLFDFYDSNKRLIRPSDLTLFYNLHVFCHITELKNNISVISIANIIKNRFYNCIEFVGNKVKVNFGIKIYIKKKKPETFLINFYSDNMINYNYHYENNKVFESFLFIKDFFQPNFNNTSKAGSTKLINLYFIFPTIMIKSNSKYNNSNWYFQNIYNNYFCFCKYSNNSNCSYENIPQKCKYFFYLYIIDNNKFLYKKTDFLFADFYSSSPSPGEAYLIFEEMIKQNLSAHFMTRRKDIYYKYYTFSNMPIIYDNYYIDGDFLEKYLDLFLKLKATVSGALIYSIYNIFYYIEYITYICIGHGISYLKDFLYKSYYGKKRYNKILLPPSDIIINNAKKYGWKDNDIIKIGLPRWDILVNYNLNSIYHLNHNKSIFIMFTWRKIINNNNISHLYFKNILKLLNNNNLNQLLKKQSITIYYSIHHRMNKYKKILILKNKLIKFVTQNMIIKCLKESSLLVTDFSSIIFDFIVQNKPYIIYIPDSEDSNLSKIYNVQYFNIINRMRNNSIYFENKYFSVKNSINKIIYYINNNFKIDAKLKHFYQLFNLHGGNNIQKFIKYLKYLD